MLAISDHPPLVLEIVNRILRDENAASRSTDLVDETEYEVAPGGQWHPELMADGVLVPDFAYVSIQPFESMLVDEATLPMNQPRMPNLRFRNDSLSISNPRPAEEGEIDEDFLAEYYADWVAGFENEPDRIDTSQSSTSGTISVVIDLSVSMEVLRPWLADQPPIQVAKSLTKWLVNYQRARKVTVDIYGGIDTGPRNVRLLKVSRSIDGINPIGGGGFRAGAMIRHLQSIHKMNRRKHTMIFMTDGSHSYIRSNVIPNVEKMFDEIQRECCVACAIRKSCRHEPNGREDDELRPIFEPLSYGRDDVDHAVAGAKNVLWLDFSKEPDMSGMVQNILNVLG